MKSFFQRFHDSQPATSKSSRTKDAAYKQRISSRPEKLRPPPSNGAEHPTEHHTIHTTSPRPSNESNADSHGHVATGYSTRYSTLPGSSTNRHLLPHPSRSRTYPLDSSANQQKGFPQNDASGPTAGHNEPPEPSGRDGNIAFRVKTERPSQSHPLSPPAPTQQHQLWLPEVQVEPKEKRRQRERQRHTNEDESVALRPQQKPDSPGSEHDGTRRHYLNERGIEANNYRRLDQKGKELSPKEHHRDQTSGAVKESQPLEQHDAHQLGERDNRKKERLKLRREKDDAEEREKARTKEKLVQDRARVKQGTSEKGEARERMRRGELDRAKEDDRIIREERHQRRELLKEKEARERQILLEQKEINERRDREREAKDERDREQRAKDERERERRERKARERQVERERLVAREQTEKEYREKYERERQERQRQRERDQQEKRDREQAELERRESEFLQRDRIPQQPQPRKDQDLRPRESKPKEIDMLRADRERQEKRKKDRQLWEQQREREREERERRWRSDQVRQIPEPNLSETGVDKSSIRSKKRAKEGVSDSEREQWHVHASDRLVLRAPTQVNELTETEDGRSAPNADPPGLRRSDCVDEPSEQQPFSKSIFRNDEYTLKKLQSQPRPPGRSVPVPDTSPVNALPSKQDVQPLASSLSTPDYNHLGFLISHNDIPPIERSGSTAPIKSTSHPVSYSVVRVPGPESSKNIPEVVAPPVARRRTASSSQDRSTTQPSHSMPNAQAQVPYPGPIPSRPGLFSNAALEGTPQDIKILPPEITSAPQTGILSVPQGSPNSFQETGSAGRGVAPTVTTAAATHLKAHGNQESPTQHNVAQPSQTAQLGSSVGHITPVPPIPNHPTTTSTGFLAVPSFHHPAKYSGMNDDMILHKKENSEYGNTRQKDSPSQAIPLQPVLPAPVSKPATTKRQSNPVPGQYEPQRDLTPPRDNFRTIHVSHESSGHAHNKMQDGARLNNISLQPTTVPPTDEFPLQMSSTLVEPQYSGDKLADRNNKYQRPTQELVPPTVTRYQEPGHDRGHHAENRLTSSVPIDSRGTGHSRHHRYASENDASRRGGKPFRYPSEGLSFSHSQQVQEPRQRTNPSFANPNNMEGNEKIAFRLPVDAPAIGTGSPDGKLQNLVSQPQLTIGPMLQDRQEHHVTMPSSAPPAGPTTSAALLGSTIVRPGTTVPRSSATQPSDDTLSHSRAIVPPIGYSQSQSASRPPIDRPSTAIGIRQSVSTTSQSLARGTQPVTSKSSSNNKAESMPFPDKPVSSVRLALTENTSQETPNEHTRSRTNSETVLVPHLSHSNESHNRLRADIPAKQAPVKEVSSKSVSQTNMTEFHNKPILPTTGLAVEIIQSMGVSYPERTIEAYDDRSTAHSGTIRKAGGTSQHQSGLPQLYSEPAARKDDSKGPPVIHPIQSRQRQQSSPHLQSEGNLLKATGQKGFSIEDQRLTTHKTGQMHSTRRVEPMREDQSLPPMPGYPTEMDAQLIQRPPADDRGRGKHSTGDHSPNAPQQTPPTLGDPAPTLSHYPGNSKIEEGRPSRSQRNAAHVKDARLAELLSPPKAIDVPGQLYLHDARRNLASKIEQQQLDGSPNSASGIPLESDIRTRTPSNRDEHTPRHVAGDSSPSVSSKASQSPDLRTRDYAHARTSPNTSQHNPSPRSKPAVVESQPQTGSHNRDEMSQHVTRAAPLRQSLRERQDHIPEVEDKYSRTHYQTSSYATNDAGMRSSDTNQKVHIVQPRVPYQMQDTRAGKTTPQRDGQRGDARDVAQLMAITHSHTQSDSQIALDNTALHSRHANNASLYAVPSNQPHALSSSDHVRPSAPTVETSLRPPDHSSYSHSHRLDRPQVPREEPIASQQTMQPPAIKSIPSIPSKRDTTEPLPQEAHYQNTSSGLQPPTPQSYDIWLPPASSREHRTSHRSTVTRTSHKDSGRAQERTRRPTTTPRTHQSSASEPHPSVMDPRFTKAYHYLKTRKVHTMSLMSVEAQDGAASTVIGSPTTSILSQIPINIPPEQDPILAAREWTEAGAIVPGQRVRKPGLVWADPEDPPLNYQQVHRPRSSLRRRTRSSGSRSREASDSDQPLPV